MERNWVACSLYNLEGFPVVHDTYAAAKLIKSVPICCCHVYNLMSIKEKKKKKKETNDRMGTRRMLDFIIQIPTELSKE